MRLSEQAKVILFGNIELIKYCRRVGIDEEKLKKCNIGIMGNMYVLSLSKENPPKSKCILHIDIDLDTQPDIVLIMSVSNKGGIDFETTSFTKRVLRI